MMLQVLLADGDDKIVANIRNLGAVKMLHRLRDSVEEGIKMTLSNFQKNRKTIVTSVKTICEVTQEVCYDRFYVYITNHEKYCGSFNCL